jgi:hypothetical protein
MKYIPLLFFDKIYFFMNIFIFLPKLKLFFKPFGSKEMRIEEEWERF